MVSTLPAREARFADHVSIVRRARRMSQEDLAAKVGVGRAAINAIEKGSRRVRLDEACDIADALGVPLADLISDRLEIQFTGSSAGPSV